MVRRLPCAIRKIAKEVLTRRIIGMQIHSAGIDLGKTTFQLAALSEAGKVLVRKKFSRRQLLTNTANM
jgi:hypothetical protein